MFFLPVVIGAFIGDSVILNSLWGALVLETVPIETYMFMREDTLRHVLENGLLVSKFVDSCLTPCFSFLFVPFSCHAEVVADDTPAVEAVLKADKKRLELLAEVRWVFNL